MHRFVIVATFKAIAFVDLPNANLGFEVGYACGVGKAIGVYRFKDAEQPPLRSRPSGSDAAGWR